MIEKINKYYCDYCKKQVEKEKELSVIRIDVRHPSMFIATEIFKGERHLCSDCFIKLKNRFGLKEIQCAKG